MFITQHCLKCQTACVTKTITVLMTPGLMQSFYIKSHLIINSIKVLSIHSRTLLYNKLNNLKTIIHFKLNIRFDCLSIGFFLCQFNYKKYCISLSLFKGFSLAKILFVAVRS